MTSSAVESCAVAGASGAALAAAVARAGGLGLLGNSFAAEASWTERCVPLKVAADSALVRSVLTGLPQGCPLTVLLFELERNNNVLSFTVQRV